MKKIILFWALFMAFGLNAQFIVGGNLAYQIPFGAKKNFTGVQLLLEKPVNERNSYYGKVSFYFPQKATLADQYAADAIDPNTQPSTLNLSSFTNFSSIGAEFGRRGYIINPIDYGFSLYGGSTIVVTFNSVKSRIQSYDKTKYQIYGSTGENEGKGNIFNLGFGVSGGMKYDFKFGTFYFDANFGYDFLQLATNSIASQGYNSFGSRLNFNLGLGFRKIIYSKK
jgi:hypothetical protein